MFGLLALLFLAVPIAELWVIVQVSDSIGFGSTLLWIVAVSVVGAWLVKQQGLSVVRRLQRQVQRAEMPTNELVDGGLILFAGALMLTPGFLTDALGLVLLVPPSRALVRTVLKRRFRGRVMVHHARPGRPVGGVWDVEAWEDAPDDEPGSRPELT